MNRVPFSPSKAPKLYCSYLIRLWQDDDNTPWRASAQSVQTGVILRFPDLESLFAFLAEQATFDGIVSSAGSNTSSGVSP